jgi:hypothetical protein
MWVGKFLTEDEPWERLNTTLDRLDQLVAHVNDAVRTPDNLVGFALSDEEPVLLIRRSLKTSPLPSGRVFIPRGELARLLEDMVRNGGAR